MSFKSIRILGYIVYVLVATVMIYVVLVADFFAQSYFARVICFSVIILFSVYISNRIIGYEVSFYLVVKKNINPKWLRILFKFGYYDNEDMDILNVLRKRAGNPPLSNPEDN